MTTTAEPVQVPAELPRRPCLPPGIHAYQRAVDELQIGVEARRGVLLTDLAPRLVAVLHSLDGRTPLGRLLARAGPEQEESLRHILGELAARGLLIDGASPRRVRESTATVVVRGDGPLAAAVAQQLAVAGIGHIAVQSEGVVDVDEIGGALTAHDISQPRRAAIERVIRATGASTVIGPPPSDRSPDLVVLTDALVPPPDVVQQLMCELQEHLVVAARDGSGIVGPLVLPHRTSCLVRPLRFTGQLVGHPRATAGRGRSGTGRRSAAATTQATAALAAAQVVQMLRLGDEPPPLLDCTIELDLREGRTLTRYWQPHPFCDCGAGTRWDRQAA